MKNLIDAGKNAVIGAEIVRLKGAQARQQSRRSRSQFTGAVVGYNASDGHAIARLPDGGIAYARTITNSALDRVAVSLPLRSTIAIADAKPVI